MQLIYWHKLWKDINVFNDILVPFFCRKKKSFQVGIPYLISTSFLYAFVHFFLGDNKQDVTIKVSIIFWHAQN